MNNDFPVISLNNSRWLHSPPSIHNIIQPYDVPTRDDLAVCLCYFSYCRYQKPLANLLAVLQDLRQAHIPYYAIELLYPNQTSVVPNPHKVVHAQTVMFHKENLYNVLVPHIPSQYSKLLFLDADIRFTMPDWYDQTSRVLDDATIMQPMGVSSWISFCKHTVSYMSLLYPDQSLGLSLYHPGFAFGINRNLLDLFGGLYDRTVIGAGDTLLWDNILRSTGHPGITSKYMTQVDYALSGGNFKEYQHMCQQHRTHIRIGCLFQNIAVHMPHGSRKNRQYTTRSNGWNIESCNIYKNDDGVYEWNNPLHDQYMREYFKSRKEDD